MFRAAFTLFKYVLAGALLFKTLGSADIDVLQKNFHALKPEFVLAAAISLGISAWRYGFVAQFFNALLPAGFNGNPYRKSGRGGYIVAQIFSLLAGALIFISLGVSADIGKFLLLLLISNIFMVYPLTPSGLGIREAIFFYGAAQLHINPETALTGAIIYTALYFITSLPGLILLFKLEDNGTH